jgi:hypothetical protein
MSTITGVNSPLLSTGGTPRPQTKLSTWASWCVASNQLARLCGGGTGLTSTMFNLGISTIQTTLQENLNLILEYELTKADKMFTDVHRTILQVATVMHHLCSVTDDAPWCHACNYHASLASVTDDANLPSVHQLLLKVGKGRTHSTLSGLFVKRSH